MNWEGNKPILRPTIEIVSKNISGKTPKEFNFFPRLDDWGTSQLGGCGCLIYLFMHKVVC